MAKNRQQLIETRRRSGSLGGIKASEILTKVELVSRARAAVAVRWAKAGSRAAHSKALRDLYQRRREENAAGAAQSAANSEGEGKAA